MSPLPCNKMFTSSSFPFASLFPQQSYLGQYYPTYGQSFYQNLQNPIQQQAQQPFMNQQAPMGMFGTQMVNPPHFNVVMEELLNDRMRDIYLDSLIMKLLESSRFYRQSDHLLRTFVEGKTLSKEEVLLLSNDRLSRIF